MIDERKLERQQRDTEHRLRQVERKFPINALTNGISREKHLHNLSKHRNFPDTTALTLYFQQGSYVGDGTASKAITGLGFQPKMVMVKADDATANQSIAAWRTDKMPTTLAVTNGTNAIDGILSFDTDGFTVKRESSPTSGRTNESGLTYYWYAFGGTALITGSYTGNGGINVIPGVGFTPVMVYIQSASDNLVHRTSAMTTEDFAFTNDTGDTDRILSFYSDGFTVGADTDVNTAATTYYFAAWKASDNLYIGTYTGDGTDNRSLPTNAMPFTPNLVHIKPDAGQVPVWKVGTLAGDAALSYSAGVSASNLIQSLAIAPGQFQVGSDPAGPNGSFAQYFFAATTLAALNGSVITKEDGVVVDSATTAFDFLEPDGTAVTSSPAGEANINLALYAKLAGRSGGQTLDGGVLNTESLTLNANAVNTAYSLAIQGGASSGVTADQVLLTATNTTGRALRMSLNALTTGRGLYIANNEGVPSGRYLEVDAGPDTATVQDNTLNPTGILSPVVATGGKSPFLPGTLTVDDSPKEYFYVGATSAFTSFSIDISTAAVYGGTPILNVEFGTDTNADLTIDTWTAVSGLVDGTNILRADGKISFTAPGGTWASLDNGSGTSRFWLRVHVTGHTLTTPPTALSLGISTAQVTARLLSLKSLGQERFRITAEGGIVHTTGSATFSQGSTPITANFSAMKIGGQGVGIAALQGNVTTVIAMELGGLTNLNNFTLTNFRGARFSAGLGPGAGTITDARTLSFGFETNSSNFIENRDMSAARLEAPALASGWSTTGVWAGFYAENQGNARISGEGDAIFIAPQINSTTNRSIFVRGAAPSLHAPPLALGDQTLNSAYSPTATLLVNIPAAAAAYSPAVTVNENPFLVGDTTLTVNNATDVEVGDILEIIKSDGVLFERLKVTAKAGNDLTVVRGVLGTTNANDVPLGTAVRQSGTYFTYSSSGDPISVADYIKADSEVMLVNQVDATNNIVSVARAAHSTTAAAHAAAAAITKMLLTPGNTLHLFSGGIRFPAVGQMEDSSGNARIEILNVARLSSGVAFSPAVTMNDPGGINASDATVVYASSGDPILTGDYILIDSEAMLVTGVNTTTNTLNITRGQISTTAASHADGSTILHVWPINVDVNANLRADNFITGDLKLHGDSTNELLVRRTVSGFTPATVGFGQLKLAPSDHQYAANTSFKVEIDTAGNTVPVYTSAAYSPTATLTNNITSSDLTLVYTSSGDPFTVNDYIQIDQEVMQVTVIDTVTNTLTITRARLDTTATVHYGFEVDVTPGANILKVTVVQPRATYRWSDDGGSTWDASLIPVHTASQAIGTGLIFIRFEQNGGSPQFALNDAWTWTAIGIANQITLLQADTTNSRLTFTKSAGAAVTLGPAAAGFLLDITSGYVNVSTGILSGATGFGISSGATETTGGGTLLSSTLASFLGANSLTLTNSLIHTNVDTDSYTGTTIYGATDRMTLNAQIPGGSFTLAVGRRITVGAGLSAPIITALYGLKIEQAYLAIGAASGTATGIEIPNLGNANFTTVTGLDILSQTAAGTNTYNIRQRGTTGVNRLAAPTLIGADASPAAGVALELRGGRLRMAASTNDYIEDSAGNRHITFAASSTAVSVTTSFAGSMRINGTLGLGAAAPTTSRITIATFPNLGAGSHNLIGVTLSGVQSANATAKRGFAFGGAWDLNGKTLTSYVGISSAPSIDDTAGTGSLLLTNYAAFQGQFLSAGSPVYTTDSAVLWALAPSNVGASVTTTHRGVYIENQGDANFTNTIGLDILAQSGSTTLNLGARIAAEAGNEILRLTSTATNDDPTESVYQNRVATTDATVTTIHTVAIPTDTVVFIEAKVVARRTGGTSVLGANGDGGGWVIRNVYRNVGGTVTEGTVTVGAEADYESLHTATWGTPDMAVSGTNAIVRVTGAADSNISWHATIRTWGLAS